MPDDTPEAAALRHSHPDWVARLWWDAIGADEARALMAANNEPAETAVRVEHARRRPGGGGGAHGRRAGWTGWGRRSCSSGCPRWVPSSCPSPEPRWPWRERSRPRPGERVLDLCAAPGAKATHLAALMEDRGEVVAVERDPVRAEELRATCARLGASCIDVRVADAREPVAGEASTACSSTRRARAWARSRRVPTCAGACASRPRTARARAGRDPRGRRRRASSGRHARLLYVHALAARERAPDRRADRSRPPTSRSTICVPTSRSQLANSGACPASCRRCRIATRPPGFFIARLRRSEAWGRATSDAEVTVELVRRARTAASPGCARRTSPAATAASTACAASS